MTKDDAAAREARAARLREEIARLKGDEPIAEPPVGETPRDFVERRMHELDDPAPPVPEVPDGEWDP